MAQNVTMMLYSRMHQYRNGYLKEFLQSIKSNPICAKEMYFITFLTHFPRLSNVTDFQKIFADISRNICSYYHILTCFESWRDTQFTCKVLSFRSF